MPSVPLTLVNSPRDGHGSPNLLILRAVYLGFWLTLARPVGAHASCGGLAVLR